MLPAPGKPCSPSLSTAFFDGLDSQARREQGTGSLLDALTRVLQEDAQAG